MAKPARWQRIVVHHSAGHDSDKLDAAAIQRFHVEQRGWRDIGYHFLVERVGDVFVAVMGRPLDMVGSHARGHNADSVGVCLVGDFTAAPPPAAQLDVAAKLIAGLVWSLSETLDYEFEDIEVVPHRELGRTACPGDSFPFDELLSKVDRRLR